MAAIGVYYRLSVIDCDCMHHYRPWYWNALLWAFWNIQVPFSFADIASLRIYENILSYLKSVLGLVSIFLIISWDWYHMCPYYHVILITCFKSYSYFQFS